MNATKTKKILIFSNSYYPKHVGGAEVAIKEITDRIARDAIEFHMITNRFDSELQTKEQIGNVAVHRIGFSKKGASTKETHGLLFYFQKILFVLQAFFKARALHKREHFDGFWAMMLYMTFPVTFLRTSGIKKPYVLTLQEGDPYPHVFKRWFLLPFRPLLRAGLKNAAIIQTISTFLARWPKDAGVENETVVIPNGIDTETFENIDENTIEQAKKEIGKQPGDIWLVHTGRFVEKNGLDTIISALSQLPSHIKFLLIGEGPLDAVLQQQAKKQGVSERVIFMPFMPSRSLPKYLCACDIFVRPSRSEGMGISFIEAMVAGLPVIATQVGGIADFLFDAKRNPNEPPTGFAVAVDSPEEIKAQVEYILKNPSEAQAVAANAKKMVEEHYNWSLIARDMEEKVFSRI